LKIKFAAMLHRKIYMNVDFFKNRSDAFLAWIGPLLKPCFSNEGNYIY